MDMKNVFLLLCLGFHQVYLIEVKEANQPDVNFDVLTLSQQWPVTQCKLWTYVTHPGGECVFPDKKDHWTLHGIWPQELESDSPMYCNDSWPLDRELMKSLEHDLDQAWTNVYKEKEHYSFWNHEWTKHGTCAVILEPFDSQLKYFKTAIEWNKKYSIADMLEAAGIFPSDTKECTPNELAAAVEIKTDRYPMVVCQPIDGVQYLEELRICFDKEINVIDCVPVVDTTCDVSKGIIYPATPSTCDIQGNSFHQAQSAPTENKTSDNDFDILTFSQEWPVTICKFWQDYSPGGQCVFPDRKDQWTVHGIWPSKVGQKGPGFCNDSWAFEPEFVKLLEQDLDQVWTNTYKETERYSFWEHEWERHGTCATALEHFATPHKYFSKAIEWHQKYFLTDMLQAAGIHPDDDVEVTADNFINAVKNRTGKDPMIVCEHFDGVQFLEEIRICFDKELNIIDCSPTVYRNCDLTRGMIFPENV
uniref:Uncharacterized protein n=1 Tax=Heliothis virescens TaxID=7102 RepID=A0A2A4J9C6_HELVI